MGHRPLAGQVCWLGRWLLCSAIRQAWCRGQAMQAADSAAAVEAALQLCLCRGGPGACHAAEAAALMCCTHCCGTLAHSSSDNCWSPQHWQLEPKSQVIDRWSLQANPGIYCSCSATSPGALLLL